MIVIKTFLVNLLCSVVSCDSDYGLPEIIDYGRFQLAASLIDTPLENPIAVTKSGMVEGYFMRSADGRLISAFEGVPFAEPPINEFRFRVNFREKFSIYLI